MIRCGSNPNKGAVVLTETTLTSWPSIYWAGSNPNLAAPSETDSKR